MARPGRRSAVEQVAARARHLSGDLLALEQECFSEIEMALATGAATAESTIRKRARALGGDIAKVSYDRQLATGLSLLMQQSLEAARASVAGMASLGIDLSLESMLDELGFLEDALAARYRGVAVEGVESSRHVAVDLVTEAMRLHVENERLGVAAFDSAYPMQARSAVSVDDLVQRVCMATPMSRPNLHGRGIWWRVLPGVNASARAVSIGLTNAVREAAMHGMNVAGAAR